MKIRGLLVPVGGAVVLAVFLNLVPAAATSGTAVATTTFTQQCSNGSGAGVAFDGKNLWYSCDASSDTTASDLFRADPTTGQVSASYRIVGGLGALAYDAKHRVIWAGYFGAGTDGVYRIVLSRSNEVISSDLAFSLVGQDAEGLVDGLAYDGLDNTLYISPDGSQTIHHYDTAGNHLTDGPNGTGDFLWAGTTCFNSGLAVGGEVLWEASDGCHQLWGVSKSSPGTVVTSFDDPNNSGHDEGLACDPLTFAAQGEQVVWVRADNAPARAFAFQVPTRSCGIGGLPYPPPGDISLTVKESPDPATVGSDITYTFRVRNRTSALLNGVGFTDSIPGSTSLISVVPSAGTCTGTDTVRCDLGTLDGSGSVVVTLTIRPSAPGIVFNSASASSDQFDTRPGNNVVAVQTTVTG